MKFMTIVKHRENQGAPPASLIQAIGQLGVDAGQKGVFVEMGGLMPSAAGAEVALKGGKITVTDGPFTEAREVFGGWAVYNVPSKQEAIDWAKRFLDLHTEHWPGFEATVEVRQVMEMPPQS